MKILEKNVGRSARSGKTAMSLHSPTSLFSLTSLLSLTSLISLTSLLSACAASPITIEPSLPPASLHEIMSGIYAADAREEPSPSYPVSAVVVPHHLTAAESIAAGIRSLTATPVERIVLLSPDHFNRCPSLLCTTNAVFKTPLGTIRTDAPSARTLRHSAFVTVLPELFQHEHGIGAVLPFIGHYLPNVPVIPLVLSHHQPWKHRKQEIADTLAAVLDDEKTLLVVSSDFSHYLPAAQADQKDEETAKALFAADLSALEDLQNPSQSDCPACLWILTKIAGERGFLNPSVLLHTNSARILHEPNLKETTSHFSIAYYHNAALSSDDPAFGGDLTFTRRTSAPALSPSLQQFWDGPGPRIVNLEGPMLDICVQSENPYIFCNKLEIWRALKGVATHWGTENNHMFDQWSEGYAQTVKLIGDERGEDGTQGDEIPLTNEPFRSPTLHLYTLTAVMNPVSDIPRKFIDTQYETVIKALQSDAGAPALKVVFIHFGREYGALQSDGARTHLHSFIDAGADAVIAHHAHVQSDMEIYRGKPIFHGIGNFIFDQFDTVPTSTSKAVRLRKMDGVVVFETLTAR